MKKIARNIIVAVLVLSLTLGIFSGCKKPIENKSLAEKYGITMSDKTVTYDGEKHALAVSVDNTILQGKSYEVTYEYGGAVLTKAEFTDAGEYGITAKIKVAGDETVYPLTNKIIIKKAPLELEVGNLFLRQGQGMATLGNPRDLFKEAAYIGKDTNAILGTLSFEIYNGNTKVNDVSTLKPSASVATPYKAKITGIKDLTNYEVKLGEGKLYVLIDSEYDNAKSLKEEIATVPTTTTIDTLDYYAMRAFASAADHIVTTYPSTTEIQKLMCGTVDVNTVKALKKTADNRISTVYDIDKDIETAICEINLLGAEHSRNEQRAKGDKLTELKNIKSARSKAEYGDVIAFNVIVYDTVKYKFTSVMINGVEFTADGPGVTPDSGEIATGKKTNLPLKYTFGTPGNASRANKDDTAYGYGIGVAENPGVISGGVQISNKLLGALTGNSTLSIKPVIGQVFDAGVYKGSSTTEITKDDIGNGTGAATNGYPELSNLTITSKGSTDYEAATNTVDKRSELILGKEYKFTVSTMTGYGIVSVEVGDKLILASQMDNGSFTLKLTEDNLSSISGNSVVKIVPTFEKVYSLAVKADTSSDNLKTLSNSNKDGVFTSNAGTIKLGGVSSTTVPTIGEEKIVNLSIKPDSGWLLAGVWIYQGNTIIFDKENGNSVDITADFEGATVVPLDLSEKRFKDKNFNSTLEINVYVRFRESYPIVVKSTYDDKTVTMSKTASNIFSSEYGIVEILNAKKEPLSVISQGATYYIKLDIKEGYVPKKIKINGKLVLSDGDKFDEGVRYPMIKSGKSILINSSLNTSGFSICQGVVDDSSEYSDTKVLIMNDTSIRAGDDFVVEIEYDAYYFVNIVDNSIPRTEKAEIFFNTYLKIPTGNSRKYTVVTDGSQGTTTGNLNESYDSASALIKIEGQKGYYCYFSTKKKIAVQILGATATETDGATKKYLDPKIIIGCDGKIRNGTSANFLSYSISVDTAITPTTVDSDIVKEVSKTAIRPGGEIGIKLITEYNIK